MNPDVEPHERVSRLTVMTRTFSPRLGIALAALLIGATACGESSPDSAADGADSSSAKPTAAATPTGEVTGLGMVIDQGEGTSLCLGPIAESYPPQCEGLPLEGWDWASRDDFEDIEGVKFAMYAVTGTFDGTTMTVTQEPISAALYDPMPDPTAGRAQSTRCEEPEGGWVIVNRARSNANAFERAEQAAIGLDGYVTHWADQFSGLEIAVSEDTEPDPDPDMGDDGTMDPLKLILNVQVTGDVDAASQSLRQVWGGALCVTNPMHDQSELDETATALGSLPGVIGTYVQNDRVVIETLYDDGSLQDYADQTYGEDMVVVTSSLRAAG